MQATVRSYDEQTRSGSVILDDGVELPFGAAALVGSRLRHVRPGQRVRIRVSPERDRVTRLTLATFAELD
ncbi:MAG: hypothetical protein M3Q27_02545 [Actinomycetota bacterium]|nr:hypothetical protein [Actinomycetota bacterium]